MQKLGAKLEAIAAVVGPCIAQSSYQVGPEFRDQFIAADVDHEEYFKADEEGRFRFDLPGFVLSRLTQAGIGDASWVGLDTCSEDQPFFSYRRSTHRKEPDFGRGLSAIVLAEA